MADLAAVKGIGAVLQREHPAFPPSTFRREKKKGACKVSKRGGVSAGCVRVLFESVEILEEEEERGIWRLQVCTNYYYERERGK